jgi:DNA invertase Pin-like site-specific DNA recombinase
MRQGKRPRPQAGPSVLVTAYSYQRFSDAAQKEGDSLRRQDHGAEAWVKRHPGHVLDHTLSMKDEGFSAFHGHHRTKGALGRFLALVEAGRITPGSILLVENIDRLSREGPVRTLREIIFKLWDHGIILQTLNPEQTYHPGCDNTAEFLALLIYIQRAQDESRQKSIRIHAVREEERKAAREHKAVITRRVPAWLRVVVVDGEEQFEVIPEAKETLTEMFEMRHQGLGYHTIEQKLNQSASWKPPKLKRGRGDGSWRSSYIKKCLRNPAVIGIFQPHERTSSGKRRKAGDPIEGFYPVVVKPTLFHAVQKRMQSDQNKGGRIDKARNLLVHMVKCGYCGGPMAFLDRGPPPKGGRYLVCDNGRRGVRDENGKRKCARYSIKYEEVEAQVLDNCPRLRPDQVMPNPDEQERRCRSLRQRIQGHVGELEQIERRIDNFTEQIGETESQSMRDRYEAKVRDLEERKKTIQSDRLADEGELHKLESSQRTFASWKRGLVGLQQQVARADGGNVEVRMRLRAHLREIIHRIDVFAVGYREPYASDKPAERYADEKPGVKGMHKDRKGDRYAVLPISETIVDTWAEGLEGVIEDANPRLAHSRKFREFLVWVMERRMSKEGRFLRVRFTYGGRVDLAPPGSLANGVSLEKIMPNGAKWEPVRPDEQRLWLEFKAECAGKGQNRREG